MDIFLKLLKCITHNLRLFLIVGAKFSLKYGLSLFKGGKKLDFGKNTKSRIDNFGGVIFTKAWWWKGSGISSWKDGSHFCCKYEGVF